MFCAKCGSQVNTNLNYCNICGAKMMKEDDESEGKVSPLNSLTTTLAFVALGGLGILVFLISTLLNKGLTHEAVAVISIFYLATLFGICFSITRLISKLIDAKVEKKNSQTEIYQTPPPMISMPTNPQLGEYHQPISSVTEHTTKTFEEEFVKRT